MTHQMRGKYWGFREILGNSEHFKGGNRQENIIFSQKSWIFPGNLISGAREIFACFLTLMSESTFCSSSLNALLSFSKFISLKDKVRYGGFLAYLIFRSFLAEIVPCHVPSKSLLKRGQTAHRACRGNSAKAGNITEN